MPVSPQDFSLWARVTGNKYPSTVKEKAKLAPDVHRFIQNLDKEGMLEGKKPKKEESLGSKVAKGALVAGEFNLLAEDIVFIATAGVTSWSRFINQVLPFTDFINSAENTDLIKN